MPGYSRVDGTFWHDDLDDWVLGQVAKSTVDGIVATETGFDSLGRPTWNKVFGKLQHTLGYHVDGTLHTYKDGRNNITTLSNWYRGVPRLIQYPDGATVSATVNPTGTIATATNEVGARTCYAYDVMGRMSSITYPSETQTGVCDTSRWARTTQAFVQEWATAHGVAAGHWRQHVATGSGHKYVYFDALWRPVLSHEYDSENAAGTQRFIRTEHDSAGRNTFTSYPGTSSSLPTGTRTTYDSLGRATVVAQDSELGKLNTLTAYLSNTAGYFTRVTNPRGHITRTWFQAFDQPSYDVPVRVTHPEGVVTAITRDDFGKPTAITRSGGGVGETRTYTYNNFQELCRQIEPETGATLMGYDGSGNLAWTAAGLPGATACDIEGDTAAILARKTARSYDSRNRPTALSFPDGMGDTSTVYTGDGLPEAITTAYNGTAVVTTTYTYNKRRLLELERMTWNTINWPIDYAYNANGHLSSQSSHGVTVTFAPNSLGQPTQAGTYASNVSFFPNGALKQFTYGNGIVHTLEQNERGLPKRSTDAYGNTAYLDDFYYYDSNGNVAAITDGATGRNLRGNRDMTYDGLDRLTQAVSPMFGTATYAYDALDNLTRTVIGGPAPRDHWYCYDGSNRLTNVKTGGCSGATVIGLGYDVQGNVRNKNGATYTFDFGNRLRASDAGSAVTYTYDGLGRRVRDSVSGQGNKYSLYSQSGQLVLVSDGHAKEVQDYVYLAGSLLAVRIRDTTTNAYRTEYYHTDALGSPVVLTNDNRQVVERKEYEPYGKLVSGSNDDRPGYTGHVMDNSSGLVYMQQRYYDPGIGMFLSVDPVTAYSNPIGQFHRYRYANNNPYKFTDPDGRESSAIRSMERDNRRFLRGEIGEAELTENRISRGRGVAAAGAVVVAGAAAIETGAVAATVSTVGKVTEAVGKMTATANAAYTSGGIVAYAKAGEVTQAVVAKASAVATAVATKVGEAKVAVMTSSATTTAVKHMDSVGDAISGYFGKGPPPMTPAGAAGGAVAGIHDEIKD